MEEILSSIRRIIADEEAEDGRDDGPARHARETERTEPEDDEIDLADQDEDDEDVLELTKVVRESGEVVDLKHGDPAPPEAAEEPPADQFEDEDEIEYGPEASPARADEAATTQEKSAVPPSSTAARPELISETAASAATGAFAKLSQAMRTPPEESVAETSGRTVEQFIEDMIRPMLKEWLDENMPALVERLVEREIQKLARRSELI